MYEPGVVRLVCGHGVFRLGLLLVLLLLFLENLLKRQFEMGFEFEPTGQLLTFYIVLLSCKVRFHIIELTFWMIVR